MAFFFKKKKKNTQKKKKKKKKYFFALNDSFHCLKSGCETNSGLEARAFCCIPNFGVFKNMHFCTNIALPVIHEV